MPVVNPLVQGGAAGGGYTPPPAGSPNDAPPAYDPPPRRKFMPLEGMGFSSPDNTSAHVGILVAGALAAIIVIHSLGFRFAVDAGVTRT